MLHGDSSRAVLEDRRLTSRSGTRFSDFAPEIQEQMYRRLGGVGLLYAGAWAANFAFYQLAESAIGEPDRSWFWHTMTAVCVAAGLAVYLLSRTRNIPASAFMNLAGAFEVLGAVGIYSAMFGWLHQGEAVLLQVGTALGHEPANLISHVRAPLDELGIRLLYLEGVTWVAVWLLIYPLIVPMSLWRTVLFSLLTASTVPAILGASALVEGVPQSMAGWALAYAIEASVPTYICAGMAIFGSRVVYKLTRDLSEAQRMGNYRLVEKIGVGGMGEVWRARHQMLARPAAIKLIRPEVLGGNEVTSRVALKRFEREVQLTTLLSHPNTITIYDYGQTSEGVFYYVMELLDGIDLETLVKRFGPAPADRVMHWLHQACGSLTEAHARGLIHRDIKPANLYACRYGLDTDFLKLLDFGLVKSADPPDGHETRMTMEHSTTGTPAYLPPEVALGEEADQRSDLYALGCVGYWLLTGQTVFDGVTPTHLAVQHAKNEPTPPSLRTELPIPADLEAIVMMCLSKSRSSRPADARALASALEDCETFGNWTAESSLRWWAAHLPAAPETEPSACAAHSLA